MSGSRGQGRRSTSVPASSNVFEADTHGAVQSYPQYHNRREGQQDSLVRSLFDQQYPPNESDYESIVSKLLGRNEMGKQHAQSRSQSTQSSQAQLQRSKQLSENKYDSGNRIWERSTFRQQKLHQMREQIRQERQAEEARECTFQPSINTKSHRLARMSRARKSAAQASKHYANKTGRRSPSPSAGFRNTTKSEPGYSKYSIMELANMDSDGLQGSGAKPATGVETSLVDNKDKMKQSTEEDVYQTIVYTPENVEGEVVHENTYDSKVTRERFHDSLDSLHGPDMSEPGTSNSTENRDHVNDSIEATVSVDATKSHVSRNHDNDVGESTESPSVLPKTSRKSVVFAEEDDVVPPQTEGSSNDTQDGWTEQTQPQTHSLRVKSTTESLKNAQLPHERQHDRHTLPESSRKLNRSMSLTNLTRRKSGSSEKRKPTKSRTFIRSSSTSPLKAERSSQGLREPQAVLHKMNGRGNDDEKAENVELSPFDTGKKETESKAVDDGAHGKAGISSSSRQQPHSQELSGIEEPPLTKAQSISRIRSDGGKSPNSGNSRNSARASTSDSNNSSPFAKQTGRAELFSNEKPKRSQSVRDAGSVSPRGSPKGSSGSPSKRSSSGTQLKHDEAMKSSQIRDPVNGGRIPEKPNEINCELDEKNNAVSPLPEKPYSDTKVSHKIGRTARHSMSSTKLRSGEEADSEWSPKIGGAGRHSMSSANLTSSGKEPHARQDNEEMDVGGSQLKRFNSMGAGLTKRKSKGGRSSPAGETPSEKSFDYAGQLNRASTVLEKLRNLQQLTKMQREDYHALKLSKAELEKKYQRVLDQKSYLELTGKRELEGQRKKLEQENQQLLHERQQWIKELEAEAEDLAVLAEETERSKEELSEGLNRLSLIKKQVEDGYRKKEEEAREREDLFLTWLQTNGLGPSFAAWMATHSNRKRWTYGKANSQLRLENASRDK